VSQHTAQKSRPKLFVFSLGQSWSIILNKPNTILISEYYVSLRLGRFLLATGFDFLLIQFSRLILVDFPFLLNSKSVSYEELKIRAGFTCTRARFPCIHV
jgi:hypothetical protein